MDKRGNKELGIEFAASIAMPFVLKSYIRREKYSRQMGRSRRCFAYDLETFLRVPGPKFRTGFEDDCCKEVDDASEDRDPRRRLSAMTPKRTKEKK